MNAQVDSGPTEECGDDEENDSITREPIREEGRHHKEKAAWALGKLGSRISPGPPESFEAISRNKNGLWR